VCGLKHTKPPAILKPLRKKFLSRKAQERVEEAKGTPESSQDSESSIKPVEEAPVKEEKDALAFMTKPTFLTEADDDYFQDNTLLSLQEKLKILKEQALAEEESKHPRSGQSGDKKDEKRKKEWDSYLMSQLSEGTATWLVHECTPSGTEQYLDLKKSLHNWLEMFLLLFLLMCIDDLSLFLLSRDASKGKGFTLCIMEKANIFASIVLNILCQLYCH
jgi:hypothetical protein